MRTSSEYPGRRRPATLGVLAAFALGCTETVPFAPASLPRPSQVTATASGPTSVYVNWNRVLVAERYRVDRAVASGRYHLEFVTLSDSISQPGFHDRGLNRSLIYVYRVAAAAGGKQSGFSDSVAVSLDP